MTLYAKGGSMEIWKPVTGMENRYEASNLGRIRGILKYGKHDVPRILATSLDERGYSKIYIIGPNGKKLTTRTHILVCLAFHGSKPTDAHTVNHKDGNKLNNTPENLEWMTRQEQAIHSYQVLGNVSSRPRGYGSHHRANYTDDEVRHIRSLHASGVSHEKIAAIFEHRTSWVTIYNIVKRKTYNHIE